MPRLLPLALALVLAACETQAQCGPGTVLSGNQCLAASAATGSGAPTVVAVEQAPDTACLALDGRAPVCVPVQGTESWFTVSGGWHSWSFDAGSTQLAAITTELGKGFSAFTVALTSLQVKLHQPEGVPVPYQGTHGTVLLRFRDADDDHDIRCDAAAVTTSLSVRSPIQAVGAVQFAPLQVEYSWNSADKELAQQLCAGLSGKIAFHLRF